jgi:hypothetical protein
MCILLGKVHLLGVVFVKLDIIFLYKKVSVGKVT